MHTNPYMTSAVEIINRLGDSIYMGVRKSVEALRRDA